MARTKETKMFPEQQEKMTQEVMASLQPSTLVKTMPKNIALSLKRWRTPI